MSATSSLDPFLIRSSPRFAGLPAPARLRVDAPARYEGVSPRADAAPVSLWADPDADAAWLGRLPWLRLALPLGVSGAMWFGIVKLAMLLV